MSKLKHYREAVTLTQTDLAHAIGKSQGAIGHYEAGRRGNPDLEICRALTSALAAAGAVNEEGNPVTLDDVFPPADQGSGEAA